MKKPTKQQLKNLEAYLKRVDAADISDFDKFNTACMLYMILEHGASKINHIDDEDDPDVFPHERTALYSSFTWFLSNEGHDYWDKIDSETFIA